ncbi:MAG TPA: hypothetical protein VHE34_02705 [Puia sp.]|uniref:hypothetical protein n=1 Tax=Puia sp. TaxID=2045100 RepID=UPI002CCDF599|nr:hypothetical protein [Puia sp.]HVU94099.1 hypothetical protein [Puia sp.]
MKFPWFQRLGVLFVPVRAAGWVLLAAALAYLAATFVQIDGHSHSVSDTLMNWMFRVLITGAVYSTIAWLTSRRSGE